MKNKTVLNFNRLHNPDIISKDCKFCVYNWVNGCPSDQSACWYCKDKSEFKTFESTHASGVLSPDGSTVVINFILR